MNPKVTVSIFIALLGGLAALNLASPARVFSENENRYLQQLPAFSSEALLSGTYTAKLDQFVTDQFFLRDGWVGLKTLSELALQKRSSNGVYFAKDGYLIEMFDSVGREQFEKNLGFVADFSRRTEDGLGVRVRTMLVPTASMILADKLPPSAPEVNQRALLREAAEALPGFVDVSGALARHSGESIYYRTDHHWTSLGALYAYSAWREEGGFPAVAPDAFDQEILSDEFYGTTYSKASLYTVAPDTITAFLPRGAGAYSVDYNDGEKLTDTMYERSYLEVKDKYSVFLNANQPVVHIETSNQNGRRLLLIKDSYANALVQMALADYEEIYVLDLRYYKLSAYDLIKEKGVTDVLLLYSIKGFLSDTNVYFLSN